VLHEANWRMLRYHGGGPVPWEAAVKKKHPLYWILERAEHLIDVGILFAIVLIVGGVIVSVFLAPEQPAYFDRPLAPLSEPGPQNAPAPQRAP
jgi:hypothetical protein